MLACRNPIDRIPKVFRNTPKLCAYIRGVIIMELKEELEDEYSNARVCLHRRQTEIHR